MTPTYRHTGLAPIRTDKTEGDIRSINRRRGSSSGEPLICESRSAAAWTSGMMLRLLRSISAIPNIAALPTCVRGSARASGVSSHSSTPEETRPEPRPRSAEANARASCSPSKRAIKPLSTAGKGKRRSDSVSATKGARSVAGTLATVRSKLVSRVGNVVWCVSCNNSSDRSLCRPVTAPGAGERIRCSWMRRRRARDRSASLTESARANRDASTSAFAAPAQAPDRKISSSRERFGSEILAATWSARSSCILCPRVRIWTYSRRRPSLIFHGSRQPAQFVFSAPRSSRQSRSASSSSGSTRISTARARSAISVTSSSRTEPSRTTPGTDIASLSKAPQLSGPFRPTSSITKPRGLSSEARNVRANWRRDGISAVLRRRIRNHRTVWRNVLAASHIKADFPAPDGPTINAARRCSIPSTYADLLRGRSATKPAAM